MPPLVLMVMVCGADVHRTPVSEPRWQDLLSFRICNCSQFGLSLGGWEWRTVGRPGGLQIPCHCAEAWALQTLGGPLLEPRPPRFSSPHASALLPAVFAQSCFGRRRFLSRDVLFEQSSQPVSWALGAFGWSFGVYTRDRVPPVGRDGARCARWLSRHPGIRAGRLPPFLSPWSCQVLQLT